MTGNQSWGHPILDNLQEAFARVLRLQGVEEQRVMPFAGRLVHELLQVASGQKIPGRKFINADQRVKEDARIFALLAQLGSVTHVSERMGCSRQHVYDSLERHRARMGEAA